MEIKLDYATFNFTAGSMSLHEVSDVLIGDYDLMRWDKIGKSDNSALKSPHGCSWLENSGYAPRPHRLQVSGLGCENFLETLPHLISKVHDNHGEISFSRLDFAFDVLIERSEWKRFISSAFVSSLESERDRKKYTLSGSGEAMTVYIGSRTSPKFFRIYNKTLEDKQFQYTENGHTVKVPDDKCVIRYEVELKRKLWNREGQKVVYDPSPFFYQYYNDDPDLLEMIRSLWLSFGDEILLPPGFEAATLKYKNKNKNFVQLPHDTAVAVVQDNVVHAPYSFDKVFNYVLDKFGQYIPFILRDRVFIHLCEDKALSRIGFLPQYDLDYLCKFSLSEIPDDDDDEDCGFPSDWDIPEHDYVQLDINLDERSAAQNDFET